MRSPFDLVTITPQSKGSGSALSLGGGQAAAWGRHSRRSYGQHKTVPPTRLRQPSSHLPLRPSPSLLSTPTAFKLSSAKQVAASSPLHRNPARTVSMAPLTTFSGMMIWTLAASLPLRVPSTSRMILVSQQAAPSSSPSSTAAGIAPSTSCRTKGFRNRLGSNGTIFTVPNCRDVQRRLLKLGQFQRPEARHLRSNDHRDYCLRCLHPSAFRTEPNTSLPVQLHLKRNSSLRPKRCCPIALALVPGTAAYVTNNYVSNSGTTESPTDKGSVKIDQNFGYNHHLAFFYNRTRYNNLPGPSGPSGPAGTLIYRPKFGLQFLRLSNELRLDNLSPVGESLCYWRKTSFIKNSYSPNVGQNWKSKVCIPNAVDCNVNFPNLSFTEFFSMGKYCLQRKPSNHPGR